MIRCSWMDAGPLQVTTYEAVRPSVRPEGGGWSSWLKEGKGRNRMLRRSGESGGGLGLSVAMMSAATLAVLTTPAGSSAALLSTPSVVAERLDRSHKGQASRETGWQATPPMSLGLWLLRFPSRPPLHKGTTTCYLAPRANLDRVQRLRGGGLDLSRSMCVDSSAQGEDSKTILGEDNNDWLHENVDEFEKGVRQREDFDSSVLDPEEEDDGGPRTRDEMLEELRNLVKAEDDGAKPNDAAREGWGEEEEEDSDKATDQRYVKIMEEDKKTSEQFHRSVGECIKQLDLIDKLEEEVAAMDNEGYDEDDIHYGGDMHLSDMDDPHPTPPRLAVDAEVKRDGRDPFDVVGDEVEESSGENRVATLGTEGVDEGEEEAAKGEGEECDSTAARGEEIERQIQQLKLEGARDDGSSEGCSDESSGNKLLRALQDLKKWRKEEAPHTLSGSGDDSTDIQVGTMNLRGGGEEASAPEPWAFAKEESVGECMTWLRQTRVIQPSFVPIVSLGGCHASGGGASVISASKRRLSEILKCAGGKDRMLLLLMSSITDSRKSSVKGRPDLTGLILWGLTRAFASVLPPSLVRGKRVLELGCGSGLIGVSASLLGAEHVTMTDRLPLALGLARENCERNGVADRTSVKKLEWSEGMATDGGDCDLVLSSEGIDHVLGLNHRGPRGEGRFDSLFSAAARHLKDDGLAVLCVRLRGARGGAGIGSKVSKTSEEVREAGKRNGLGFARFLEMPDLCGRVQVDVPGSEGEGGGGGGSLEGCACIVLGRNTHAVDHGAACFDKHFDQ